MVAANLTDKGAKLVVRGPGTRVTSGPLIANGNASLEASLKAGTYTISAAGIPGAKPTRLIVGNFRTSSSNNLLLP